MKDELRSLQSENHSIQPQITAVLNEMSGMVETGGSQNMYDALKKQLSDLINKSDAISKKISNLKKLLNIKEFSNERKMLPQPDRPDFSYVFGKRMSSRNLSLKQVNNLIGYLVKI